jgi:hypothetical protein
MPGALCLNPCNVLQRTADEPRYIVVIHAAVGLLPWLLLHQLLHSSAVGSVQLPSNLAIVVARLQAAATTAGWDQCHTRRNGERHQKSRTAVQGVLTIRRCKNYAVISELVRLHWLGCRQHFALSLGNHTRVQYA